MTSVCVCFLEKAVLYFWFENDGVRRTEMVALLLTAAVWTLKCKMSKIVRW